MQGRNWLGCRDHKLLYVCDKPDSDPPLIHLTFSVERVSGDIVMPTNELDENPISDVRFAAVDELDQYGFSKTFIDKIKSGFSDSGSYMGLKTNIGL